MAKRSMFDQWLEFKKLHPNSIIFFRVGTFFEMLEIDAYIVRKTLGFKMSVRQKGKGGYIPMVGFPRSAFDIYSKKLVLDKIGYVVVEQLASVEDEDGIRARQIIDVVTPKDAIDLGKFKKAYQSYLNRDFPLTIETFELNRAKRVGVNQSEKFLKQLRDLNINKMSGFEAQKLLYDWQQELLKKEG